MAQCEDRFVLWLLEVNDQCVCLSIMALPVEMTKLDCLQKCQIADYRCNKHYYLKLLLFYLQAQIAIAI